MLLLSPVDFFVVDFFAGDFAVARKSPGLGFAGAPTPALVPVPAFDFLAAVLATRALPDRFIALAMPVRADFALLPPFNEATLGIDAAAFFPAEFFPGAFFPVPRFAVDFLAEERLLRCRSVVAMEVSLAGSWTTVPRHTPWPYR